MQLNNEKFVAVRESSAVISERETALRNLDVAYSTFKAIRVHLNDALRFYTDLDHALRDLFDRTQSYVLARKSEARELLSEFQVRASAPASSFPRPDAGAQQPVARFDPMTGRPLQQPYSGDYPYGAMHPPYGGAPGAPYGSAPNAPYGGAPYGGAPNASPYYGGNGRY